jgi:predicted alpha-1,6-mannanase (GH76 family)
MNNATQQQTGTMRKQDLMNSIQNGPPDPEHEPGQPTLVPRVCSILASELGESNCGKRAFHPPAVHWRRAPLRSVEIHGDSQPFLRYCALNFKPMNCRFRMTGLLAVGTAFLLGTFPALAQTSAATYHNRADQALQSFLLKFWSGGQQYLWDRYPNTNNQLTGYWTYAHGWDALMDGVERTGRQQYFGLIETFYLGQNDRGWFSGYYDDECWMTMALLRAYDLTGTVKYLNQAKTIYADIQGGWDTSCCGTIKGGVWWDKGHTQKATASNAGAALAGARLYRRTGDISYLTFAQQVYSYWYSNMVNAATFQVGDHIDPDGTKVWWKFTYNDGLMVGASLELNEATGDGAYLTKAINIGNFMISNEVIGTSSGNVLYDGANNDCAGDCHEFKGPGYRYLMRLYSRTNRAPYFTVLKSSADAIWNLARETNNTIFSVHWGGPVQTSVEQSQDNAACIGLSRFAQQFGSYPGSGIPANCFEGENATLHHLGVEAIYPGFTGWGYIASWLGDGKWIDYNVYFPTGGTHTLTFRYAAGAGNASRLIFINGANAFPNQSFPNTGAWSTYSTVSVSYTFPPGYSAISLIYNSSLGNNNFLNVDNLTIPTLVAAPPGPLLATSENSNLILSWTTPGFLQSGPGLFGPWADVSGNPYSPVTLSPTDMNAPMRFYRLRW